MRMHNRSMFKKYVRHADIGDAAVNEIWHGDTQLYPENETLVKKMLVTVPTQGTLAWAYWVHCVRGVSDKKSGIYHSSAQMKLTIGSESWWCGLNRPTGLYLCSITESGELTFNADEGPALADVDIGDYITLKAVIYQKGDTEHSCNQQDVATAYEWGNPWLPDTKLYLMWGKGQEKKSAGVEYCLKGVSSGKQMLAGNCAKDGHDRGVMVVGYALPDACRVGDRYMGTTGDNQYVEGDTGLKGTFSQFNSCYYLLTYPLYPAFSMTFNVQVKSLSIQSSK